MRDRQCEADSGGKDLAAPPAQSKGDHRLAGEQSEHADADEQRVAHGQADVGRHAHRHEEEAEQQALERLDVRLQLVPVFRFRQHHPGGEGAERQRQVGPAGQGRRTNDDQQGGGGEQFAGLGAADGAEQRLQQIAAGEYDHGDRAAGLGCG